jgi:hypothetical protein
VEYRQAKGAYLALPTLNPRATKGERRQRRSFGCMLKRFYTTL